MINPFLDDRPIPSVKVNFKVKVKTNNAEEYNKWNSFFSYIMKKQRTKIEFVTISIIRNLSLFDITVDKLQSLVSPEDYEQLKTVEDIFNNRISTDLKAFILSILQVQISKLS